MEVILQEDFPALGYIGDRVKVKRGYARNYLLPRGIAVEVLSRNANLLKHKLSVINAKRERKKAEASAMAERLGHLSLDFHLKATGATKSFGSVTTKEIEAVLKEKGFALDRRQIRIAEPFKTAGTHQVFVKLHSEITATINAVVTLDKIEKKTAPREEDDDSKAVGRKKAPRKEGKSRKKSEDAVEDADA